MTKIPDECYKEYGSDLDGCSTQEREGCGSCVLAKHVTPNDELIQQARSASLCSPFGSMIRDLCDALEAAQKELIDYHHTQKTVDGKMAENARLRRINEQLTARVEKAEAERDTYKAALQNWHEQEGAEL